MVLSSVKVAKLIKRGLKMSTNQMFDKSKELLCQALDFSGSPEELEALRKVNQYHLEHFPNGEAVKRMESDRIITSQNNKVGKKVLILNLTPAIRCKESMDGHCAVQKQIIDGNGVRDGKINCYALRAEWQYVNKFQNSLWNYIMIHEKPASEIAEEILEDIGKKNITHIRFNENGCFATAEIADKAMEVAKILKRNGVRSYSYTSDPEMYSRIEGSDIVINLSNGDAKGGKNTKVIFPTRENALDIINSKDKVLCGGHCSTCPYCKDAEDKRTVVFLLHSGNLPKKEDLLTKEELERLEKTIEADNEAYLEREGLRG